MTRHNVPLGRILGIPIGLDYSWFLIFALLTWILGGSYYPAEFKNWSPLLYWFMGAVTAVMLFASVLLHELGHCMMALRYKVPVRSITLFLFGGVAQIGTEPPSAIAEFFIAIAGPFVSLVLALCSYAVQSLVAGIESLLGHVGVSRMFSGNFGGGLWIAFIGWFLDNAASAQVHAVMFQSLACCPATQFPRP